MEHFVEIIHYIAWPIVVLIILYSFRSEFKRLINRIKSVKYGNATIECSETVDQDDVEKLPTDQDNIKMRPHIYGATTITEAEALGNLLKDARKVLATLWKGQNRHFTDISEGQWSFRVLPHSPVYGNFMVGFAQLLALGLAGWERKNGQAVLTKKGWEYAKEHPEIKDSEDVYMF